MLSLIEDTTDPVTVSIQKNFLLIDLEHTKITTRLLDGDFINYKQILPTKFETTIVVARENLDDALDRASLLVRAEKTNLVKFEISGKTLGISSNSEIGNINENLNIKLDGVELKIAFNCSYFTQLLKTITTQNITIKFINANNPAVIAPSGTTDDVMFLVLPVRLMN
jgi:DNA polymerase-3 subunit beta